MKDPELTIETEKTKQAELDKVEVELSEKTEDKTPEQETKEALLRLKQERSKQCTEEVAEILLKYQCYFDVTITITGTGKVTGTAIILPK